MADQMHGKVFENLVKAANGMFGYAAADRHRAPDEPFDIGAELDICHGLATSVKTTNGSTITLSDARSFWQSLERAPYRILVGHYRQRRDRKTFFQISEFIVKPEHAKALLGEVTLAEIETFHNGMKGFGKGAHVAARAWAIEEKQRLGKRLGHVTLNPKIDSKSQRRLQCSVDLRNLWSTCGVHHHTSAFGKIALPVSILSGPRR